MTNSTIENTRKNIKKIRIDKGFTQAELSEMAGITCDYLSEVERGKKVPSLETIHCLAQALNVEPYRLLMRSE